MSRPAGMPRAGGLAGERKPVPWLRALRDWPQALLGALEDEPALVRVVLAAVRGSAPREPGVGMLVGRERLQGTIGGGQLEWQAVALARQLLGEAAPARIERVVLATDAGQCCGGVVELWFERFTRAELALLRLAAHAARRGPTLLVSRLAEGALFREIVSGPAARVGSSLVRANTGEATLSQRLDEALPPLWLYGAGHVGQAIARIATELPLELTWIDARDGIFPATVPDSVRILCPTDPVGSVASAPPGTRFAILTHSHALDYALSSAVLARRDFAWAGLIGSASKAARFRARLLRDGVDAELLGRLVCPIGVAGIASKWPSAIAVAVVAQILQDIDASRSAAAAGTSGVARAADAPPAVSPGLSCGAADCAKCGQGRGPDARSAG